jgi:tetratricopeptide (TPR) repeat protein
MEKWDRCAFMAIQIDAATKTKISAAFRKKLKKELVKIAEGGNGIWFSWIKNRFGAAVPDIDASEAATLARAMQSDLADHHIETVSIGITEFPLQQFDQRQCLTNAAKALDHGAFFGADTCVTFDSVSLNVSGDRYYQADDLEGAIHEYQLALDLDAANINVRNSLGVCLAKKGELDAARSQFEAVCRTYPHDAMALFNTGLIHLNQSDRDSARAFFEKAYAADQSMFEIPYQLGKLLFEQGRWDQALDLFKAGEKIRSNYAPLFTHMGRCLSEMEQTEQAITAYKKAIKLNPNDAMALSNLGTLYAKKGENPDICVTFCRQSVLIEPGNSLYRFRLARCYHEQGQWDHALAEYEKAAELGHDVDAQLAEVRSRMAAEDENKRCA